MPHLYRDYLWVMVWLAVVSGCAHRGSVNPVGNEGAAPQEASTSVGALQGQAPSDLSFSAGKSLNSSPVLGVHLVNKQFDIPITINSQVEAWVEYFTGRGRPHFEVYLRRSVFFIPFITPILKEYGLPHDLVYLAMIESGFNNQARSRARAVGPWQFISATGRRYGLAVNWWIDERRDIRKSTVAAIQYLRDLYQLFGSWELAAAAYNAGEAKVARAIRRFGTRDFWSLSRQQFLKKETRDYVPKMMAAAIVAKNRELFGFASEKEMTEAALASAQERSEKPYDSDRLVSILKEYDADYKKSGRRPATLIRSTVIVDQSDSEESDGLPETLPESGAEAVIAEASEESQESYSVFSTPHVTRKGEAGGEQVVEFEVESPADLFKIARAAGVPYEIVKSLNPEVLRWCTPPGAETYRIKLPASAKEQFLITYNHPAYPREIRFRSLKVRSGDSVRGIARRFGIGAEPIEDLNQLTSGQALRSGTTLYLPMPSDLSRSLASLDLTESPKRRHYRKPRKGSPRYSRR